MSQNTGSAFDLLLWWRRVQVLLLAGGFFWAIQEIRLPWLVGLVVAASALLFVLGSLNRHGGRDALLRSLSIGLCVMALGGAAFLFRQRQVVPWVALGTAAATVVSILLRRIASRNQATSDSIAFPNLLLGAFPAESVLETHGVQFAGFLRPGEGTSPHWLVVVLQNCFDAPRQVTVQLDGAADQKYLRFQSEFSAELGPAEVSEVCLPVVSPTYSGSYRLYFGIAVVGTGGARVRTWLARLAEPRVTTAETVGAALLGHLAVGGGTRVNVGPLASDLWACPLPPAQRRVIWQPVAGTSPAI